MSYPDEMPPYNGGNHPEPSKDDLADDERLANLTADFAAAKDRIKAAIRAVLQNHGDDLDLLIAAEKDAYRVLGGSEDPVIAQAFANADACISGRDWEDIAGVLEDVAGAEIKEGV